MGNTSHHITKFKIENFKRFESFEMRDLGQFNLIVGDNNVGKTTLLESLLINTDSDRTFNNLINALKFRNLTSTFTYKSVELFKNIKSSEKADSICVSYEETQGVNGTIQLKFEDRGDLIYKSKRNNEDAVKTTKELYEVVGSYPHLNFPFVPFYKGHDDDLTVFYSKLQKDRTLKNRFINDLRVILPNLENIEPTTAFEKPHLIVYQAGIDQTLPLAFFGDGVLKLFRLLAEININRGDRLMIDEVDTGIHYSRFKEFWKTILGSAAENGVQLFMTTHSDECIRYFKEVLEDDFPHLKKDARSITLVQNTRGEVEAFTYTFDQLEANIEVGNEIRGGI